MLGLRPKKAVNKIVISKSANSGKKVFSGIKKIPGFLGDVRKFIGHCTGPGENKTRNQQILDNLPETVVVFDLQGRIENLNRTAAGYTHFSPEECIGRSLFDLFSKTYAHGQTNLIKKVIQTGEKMVSRDERSHDGSRVYFHTTWIPLRDQDHKISSAAAIKRDITHQLLQEKQTHQISRMEALGKFAAGITHDFNNIMGGIMINTELIKGSALPSDPVAALADDILHSGNQARDLVSQILNFSRGDTHEREYLDMITVIQKSLRMVGSLVPSNINIHSELNVKKAIGYTNSCHIHQVMINLCSNAAHAMKKNGGEITIKVEETLLDYPQARKHDLDQGMYWKLTVMDTGCGMNKKVADRIFEPFFTTKSSGEGTGMGLAVVKEIVKSYDGVLSVSTRVNKGCSITILLPKKDHSHQEL